MRKLYLAAEHIHDVRVVELLRRLRRSEHGIDNGQEYDHDEDIEANVSGPVALWFQKNFTSLKRDGCCTCCNLALEHADVGEVAVFLGVVEAVAHTTKASSTSKPA